MSELDDAESRLRSEVGRAMGFVIGSLVLVAQDGRLPSPADVQNLLEHYRRQFKAFTPEVEEIVVAMTDGLAFAAREGMDGVKL
jgi:hypothetical protein